MVVALAILPAVVAGIGEGCEDAHIGAECFYGTMRCRKLLIAVDKTCGMITVVRRKNEQLQSKMRELRPFHTTIESLQHSLASHQASKVPANTTATTCALSDLPYQDMQLVAWHDVAIDETSTNYVCTVPWGLVDASDWSLVCFNSGSAES